MKFHHLFCQANNSFNWIKLLGMLIIMSIWSCQERELPDEFIGTPVFFVDGNLDGKDLAITAGDNGYYMESGYEQDEQEVYVFTGTFTPLNCDVCPEALEVRIRDHRLRNSPANIVIDSVLQTGSYDYFQKDNMDGSAVFRVSFSNQSAGAGPFDYSWEFGDGSIGEGPNPVHDYVDTQMTSVLVCLDGTDPTGCTTQICNEVQLEDIPCKADFIHELEASTTYVRFTNEVEGAFPIRYRWDFGDGYGASLGNPGYFYQQPDLYEVCLEIIDANGCKSSICKNIAADPDLCEHNFTYKVENTTLPDTLQFSRVEVRWTDETAATYSTAHVAQSLSSYFEILEIEPYENNRHGDLTRRLKVRFNCEIEGDSGQKSLQQVEGYLAIAFPKESK